MKKWWVVGLLSIIPGLGLLALGQVAAGVGVMAGTGLLILLSLITTSADLSTGLFVFTLIIWMLQLGYSLLAAIAAASPKQSPKQIARREATRKQLEAAVIQREAREALMPLLLPGQHLRIALDGMGGVDARILGGILLALLNGLGGGGYAGGPDRPTTIIGITEDELVFSTTRRIPQPSDLHRIPIAAVSLVEFKERRLGYDRLVLSTGKRELRLYTAQSLRPAIQELAAILHNK
jgi:hypothetical protein